MENAKILIDHNASTLSLEDFLETASNDTSDLDLLTFFQEEVTETLTKTKRVIKDWNQSGSECPLEELRREFHTIKGAANSIGQLRIGALADGMKGTLDLFDRKRADLFLQDVTKASILTVEAIRGLLAEAMNPKFEQVPRSRLVQAVNAIRDLRMKVHEARRLDE